jgi:hypothetical protein
LTSFVLEALHENDMGHLWSIDLPPLLPQWHVASGALFTADLRARWTLLRGASRRRLPRLLGELESIDLFVHDSLHTERNMHFEFTQGWSALKDGGVLVSDDAGANAAFSKFTKNERGTVVVAQEELKCAKFAIIVKSP